MGHCIKGNNVPKGTKSLRSAPWRTATIIKRFSITEQICTEYPCLLQLTLLHLRNFNKLCSFLNILRRKVLSNLYTKLGHIIFQGWTPYNNPLIVWSIKCKKAPQKAVTTQSENIVLALTWKKLILELDFLFLYGQCKVPTYTLIFVLWTKASQWNPRWLRIRIVRPIY